LTSPGAPPQTPSGNLHRALIPLADLKGPYTSKGGEGEAEKKGKGREGKGV